LVRVHRKLDQFPFLIGTVRTIKKDLKLSSENEFPFLIGTVRTVFSHNPVQLLPVSIPHRYGKNQPLPYTVQIHKREVSIPHRYGKNERGLICMVIAFTGFPFLIGTVRTRKSLQNAETPPKVSIPHRYGKNAITCE